CGNGADVELDDVVRILRVEIELRPPEVIGLLFLHDRLHARRREVLDPLDHEPARHRAKALVAEAWLSRHLRRAPRLHRFEVLAVERLYPIFQEAGRGRLRWRRRRYRCRSRWWWLRIGL